MHPADHLHKLIHTCLPTEIIGKPRLITLEYSVLITCRSNEIINLYLFPSCSDTDRPFRSFYI